MGAKHNLQEWLLPLGTELSTKHMGEKENAVSIVERIIVTMLEIHPTFSLIKQID